jgi:crotonobetainyl-CoA hydratase
VTIDRPERHNAVHQATEAELIRIWETIEKDRDIRVAVLTGAGARAFCTGADIKGGSGATGLEYWAKARLGGFGGIALRDKLDVPAIARVNGYALGGGMEMMLGCDIVVASADATFGLPESRLGRLGLALLARRIPHVQAMGMLLTGRRIGADEALRYGLVNDVVASDEPMKRSRAASPTSSPARRCRCTRSSRWCGRASASAPKTRRCCVCGR